MSAVRTFDLVVALTNGGPSQSTEVPAKFIMDSLFARQDLGLAIAAATVMLVTVMASPFPFSMPATSGRTAVRGPYDD